MKESWQTLGEHFRCPEEFARLQLQEQWSEQPGFFQFGPDITCYGRLSSRKSGSHAQSHLYDATHDVVAGNSGLLLPFDPAEIIDNLRRECYVSDHSEVRSLMKQAYYALRPLMSDGLRRLIQRAQVRNWQKLMFPHWPVDTTVEDLCGRLLLLSMEALDVHEVPFIWFWPEGARSCVLMTHDVETEAGRDFCPTLIDIDDAYGIKAAFQIVPEGRYDVTEELLAMIRQRGCEVGVQDLSHDGRLFDDRGEFFRRAEKINQYGRKWGAKGFRAAILYRKPEWFSSLRFAYDMSIPNVAHLDPQRGGCCTVFPYFIGDVLELPVTTTQDYMLLNLLEHDSIDLWKKQFELISRNNGLVSFITHPDYVVEPKARALYEGLVGFLREASFKNHIWFALPAEIDQWWRARSKMNVVPDGHGWRIEGEGAERAVLAYARSEGGRLVYDLQMATA